MSSHLDVWLWLLTMLYVDRPTCTGNMRPAAGQWRQEALLSQHHGNRASNTLTACPSSRCSISLQWHMFCFRRIEFRVSGTPRGGEVWGNACAGKREGCPHAKPLNLLCWVKGGLREWNRKGGGGLDNQSLQRLHVLLQRRKRCCRNIMATGPPIH